MRHKFTADQVFCGTLATTSVRRSVCFAGDTPNDDSPVFDFTNRTCFLNDLRLIGVLFTTTTARDLLALRLRLRMLTLELLLRERPRLRGVTIRPDRVLTISDARENYVFFTIKTRTPIKLGILLPKLYKSHPPVP